MLKIAQTVPLWNFHHRFCNLNCFRSALKPEMRKRKKHKQKHTHWKGKLYMGLLMMSMDCMSTWLFWIYNMWIRLTVCGCETGTPTVRPIKFMAITMQTATIDQIFIFLDFLSKNKIFSEINPMFSLQRVEFEFQLSYFVCCDFVLIYFHFALEIYSTNSDSANKVKKLH